MMIPPAPKKKLMCIQSDPSSGHFVDPISELPDEVLICILSCLSIQEAAKTSILSRRWKNLWKLMIFGTLSLQANVVSNQSDDISDHFVDQISELPDEVLISILSRLSIKEAARTRILSRRWKNLWKLMINWSLSLRGTGRE